MNIYGECRTAIANKPKNFAKLFNVTYYKKINNTNIYCTNNNFKFRLVTGQCVKEFGFKTNKKKYSLVDLTPDIQGIEVVMNNNLDGTLTCYARHNGYYSSIVTQVTQCDGLGFIDFINLDNFDTSKDSLLNILPQVSLSSIFTFLTPRISPASISFSIYIMVIPVSLSPFLIA